MGGRVSGLGLGGRQWDSRSTGRGTLHLANASHLNLTTLLLVVVVDTGIERAGAVVSEPSE